MLPRTGDQAHMGSSAWGLLLGLFYKFESTVSREIKTKFDLPITDSYLPSDQNWELLISHQMWLSLRRLSLRKSEGVTFHNQDTNE